MEALSLLIQKSLVTIEQIRASKEDVTLIKTPGYIPPEIRDNIRPDEKINIENIHAFILGANLYDYLTGWSHPMSSSRMILENLYLKALLVASIKNKLSISTNQILHQDSGSMKR